MTARGTHAGAASANGGHCSGAGSPDRFRNIDGIVWAFDPSAADDGYFGPASIAWKVLSEPAAVLLVAQITNLLEVPHVEFQSVLLDHDPLYPTNPRRQRGFSDRRRGDGGGGYFHDRIGRTIAVPLPIVFGDRTTAERCAAKLFDYHKPMRGMNPDTRRPYAATDADAMLFAAVTIAHAALRAYETFAFADGRPPRRLRGGLRDRYFREMAELAVLMGVPRDRVPVSAREIGDYYRSLSSEFMFRRGWVRAQLQTVLRLLPSRWSAVGHAFADFTLIFSAVLALPALPRPSRRLNRIPAAADPMIAAMRVVSLPLFALLQIPGVACRLQRQVIGGDNVAALTRARSMNRHADETTGDRSHARDVD